MKVVLFCGGLGLRIRNDAGSSVPKPLVTVGDRPILWHLMRYYAHYGHREFILCLGHRGEAIRDYVRGRPEFGEWQITLADTGVSSTIGQRLVLAKPYLAGDEVFLCNYADGLTDLPLPELIAAFVASGKVGMCLCPRPSLTCHFVRTREDGTVVGIEGAERIDLRINGGYFVFRQEIFDYIHDGEDLVGDAFHRLVREGQLLGYRYDGFWKNMDTFNDKQALDDLYTGGTAPWQVWRRAKEPRDA